MYRAALKKKRKKNLQPSVLSAYLSISVVLSSILYNRDFLLCLIFPLWKLMFPKEFLTLKDKIRLYSATVSTHTLILGKTSSTKQWRIFPAMIHSNILIHFPVYFTQEVHILCLQFAASTLKKMHNYSIS